MKKLGILLVTIGLMTLGACENYHTKQPVDSTYYKKTQSVAWPESGTSRPTGTAKATAAATNTAGTSSDGETGIPFSATKKPDTVWHDAEAPVEAVPIPAVAEKKIKCIKDSDGSYTCRYGQTRCGTGCKADASNCYYGYCLKSECDDVMGQKWDWVKSDSWGGPGTVYACQHPSYGVKCQPNGSDGIMCKNNGSLCGYVCNKNGTDCGAGSNNCWDKYR